jgi:hypothetical protein
VNRKISKIIEIARIIQPNVQNGKNFHVSAAFKKRKIIGFAWNDYSEPNLAHVFGEYLPTRNGENYQAGRHSETQLIKKLGFSMHDLTIVNVRIDKNGQPMMAKPCINCQKQLDKFGYKRIYYTIADSEYGVIHS